MSDEHNLGSFLPKETKWTDLLDIRFKRDGSAALLEYDTDEFDESNPRSSYHLDQYFTDEEYSDWLRLSFSDKASDHEKEALDIVKQLEDFTQKQIEDPSFSQGLYEGRNPLCAHDGVYIYHNMCLNLTGMECLPSGLMVSLYIPRTTKQEAPQFGETLSLIWVQPGNHGKTIPN